MLKQRLVGALVAGLFCLGLACAALAWQALRHGQQQQASGLLELQAHAWQQLQAQQMARLEQIAARWSDGHGPASPQAMHTAVSDLPGLRIDLLDENARLLATTADGIHPAPLLDPLAVTRWTPGQAQGLHQLPSRQYSWLQRVSLGPQVLVLSLDVAAVLPQLSQRLPGDFFLLNMRGTPVAGSADDGGLFSQVLLPARAPQVLTLDAQPARPAALRLVSQPLTGANGAVIASLVWRFPADAAVQAEHRFTQRAMAAGSALLLLAAGGIFLFIRHALSPLTRGVNLLHSLAQGDTDAALYGGEEDAQDESGTVARSVMQLRSELLNLETLRQERVRTRRQQERLIRDQLRSLASNLDPASREEILTALGSQERAQTTPSPEASNVLADLAGILGRMSGLVNTQQSRLIQLLREVQASVQTQAMLASLQQELEIARQMQLSILPRQTPERREIDIASAMIPAKEIGGDFYDYFAIDADHLAIVIADVSGKGVPAAFFMAISRTLLKSNALFLRTPGATISALNDQLCTENDQMMFVTVFYAVLQLSSGLLTFVNAGHNPPILLRQDGAQYFPKGRNMALAVLEGQPYHEGTLQLSPGDCLLLYTDGVTEASDAHNALFGDARLLQAVQTLAHLPDRRSPARRLTDHILRAVRQFEAGAAQADDITMVAITYRGLAP